MEYQTIFERYELKYLITPAQKEKILRAMDPYMALDQYGRTVIRNLYFDTENYRVVRKSMERPVYKEKLRIRSYQQTAPDDPVFVELKKKYDSVVYKRRLAMPLLSAVDWVTGRASCKEQSQIAKEIDYFLQYYQTLRPMAFLSYEREAFYDKAGGEFRITFDDNVLFRQDELSLEAEVGGVPLLGKDQVLMEVKCSGGVPLWLTRLLSEEKIYKTSFSKYGNAYQNIILPRLKEVA